MYEYTEVDKSIVDEFNLRHCKGHIFQTSKWAELKKFWSVRFISGYDESKNLVLTAAIHIRKLPYINRFIGYIPRGFVCDYENEALINSFTVFLKDFSKKNRISFITIDPDIHLKENNEFLDSGVRVGKALEVAGFLCKSSKNFEGIQPNFVFRLNIDDKAGKEEEEKRLLSSFDSRWRYKIKIAEERGLTVEVYNKDTITEDILDDFQNLMEITGKRDNFIVRQKEYFKDMLERLDENCRLFMVKYSWEKDNNRISDKINAEREKLDVLRSRKSSLTQQLEAERDSSKGAKIGKKIVECSNKMGECEKLIENFIKKQEEVSVYKGQEIYLSGAVYLWHGSKAWYLYGASHNILRDTMANYLMQWSMIKSSIERGCTVYDFRGVSGDLSESNPLYGLYKFKKGFGGNFVEFIGEYDLVVDKVMYAAFRYAFPKFKDIRNKVINKKR